MSLDTAVAQVITRPLIATIQEIAAFKKRHLPGVDAAIESMQQKIQPGVTHRQVITPLRTKVNDTCASPVREDFSNVGCAHSILMRSLFRDNCPEEIEIYFDYAIGDLLVSNKDDPDNSHMETVVQLVVCFFISQRQTRIQKKK